MGRNGKTYNEGGREEEGKCTKHRGERVEDKERRREIQPESCRGKTLKSRGKAQALMRTDRVKSSGLGRAFWVRA